MNNLNVKITAIVPALNEEKNVGKVLKTLLESKVFNQVILVDDGSVDKTSEIGLNLGVEVIKLPKIGGSGKGNAMRQGVKASQGDIVVFFDADLIGLTEKHISLLIEPLLKEEVQMCIGIRGRFNGLPLTISKIDPLMAIGGERALRRDWFLNIPEDLMQGFAVETTLNYYCLVNKLPIKYVLLPNLEIITKERKWGFLKGLKNRIKMIWQMLKIRLIIISNKNEFIQKNNIK